MADTVISFARKFLKKLFFAQHKINAPEETVTNIFVHDSSEVVSCVLSEWVKVQKQSYLYNSKIESYTYLAGFNSVMNAEIGKFCSIGAFVSIGPGKHPIEFVSTSPVFYSIHKQCGTTFADASYYKEMGSVKIGNDVWIGSNAIILDNVIIGDGAVIAAGAVVTQNVEPYSIVGGIPAKLIKKRFSDDLINTLIKFEWWNKDQLWLKENYKLFHDINSFINFVES